MDWSAIDKSKTHQRNKSEPNSSRKSEPSHQSRHKSFMQKVKYENALRKIEENRVIEEKKRLVMRKA